jgi:hypothetical protein
MMDDEASFFEAAFPAMRSGTGFHSCVVLHGRTVRSGHSVSKAYPQREKGVFHGQG